jgi:SAM-dependent methyltransferase
MLRRAAGRPLRAAIGKPESISGYAPSPLEVVNRMLELAEVGAGDVVYDLGCGDGRTVIEAARRFGARGVGIDLDPRRIEECHENARAAGVESLVRFCQQDVMNADFSSATVVLMYLPPQASVQLGTRLMRELAPGARIVSHNADPGGWDTVEVLDGRGNHPSLLYLRKVPPSATPGGSAV